MTKQKILNRCTISRAVRDKFFNGSFMRMNSALFDNQVVQNHIKDNIGKRNLLAQFFVGDYLNINNMLLEEMIADLEEIKSILGVYVAFVTQIVIELK